VNYLSHFILINRLLEYNLINDKTGRIVNISSLLSYRGTLNIEQARHGMSKYSAQTAYEYYNNTKYYLVLFTYELERVRFYVVSPGVLFCVLTLMYTHTHAYTYRMHKHSDCALLAVALKFSLFILDW